MKNLSSMKNNSKNESPKTPGGISKSLLTPCRRVGLSRNWKKKGPSPFISPLASNTSNNEPVVEKKETRKRKSIVEPEEKSSKNIDSDSDAEADNVPMNSNNAEEIVKTPLRNVELPRRKKSKTFLATLNSQVSSKAANTSLSQEIYECTKENVTGEAKDDEDVDIETPNTIEVNQVVKEVSPSLKNSKRTQKSKKFQSPLKSAAKTTSSNQNTKSMDNILETPKEVSKPKERSDSKPLKARSPNELTKECIVVIQKKLLKVKEKYNKGDEDVTEVPKKNSQPLFDSDDEAPLSTFNKKEIHKTPALINTLDDDDDDDEFVETSSKNKSKKTENTNQKISNSKVSLKADKVQKPVKQASKVTPITESKPPSQSSFDNDDDFLDKKKTILIRKTYEKVSKLNKAKSTGSITQRDIDDLKARIELKKKMLLARSMTGETEELRSLIKKWQKGCQEALVELMDLMKIKCPDKHNMDYSEILQMLKIPPSLVGYDSDHDCFNTPDDSSAVLSKYNDF